MSWMFKRDPVWKYLQTVQYGVHGHFPHLPYPTFFPCFEFQDVIPPDDFLTSDEELDSVLFGSLRGQVVGLRYYTGVVNNNEMVALQREPNNAYDKNAIKVNNVNGNQVGYLKKELAVALAYIMDNKLAQVEGVVPFGANNTFTMPLQMTFWGKEENKKAVLDQLNKHGFKLGPAPKTLGFSLESGWGSERARPSHSMPGHAAVQMTTEQLKTEFDRLFEDLKEDDKTQEMEPAEAIETPLLSHQKQALAWMISRENSKELPPFWEQRNDLYYNTITNFSEKERPENVHGGVLADDMGLGKTLTAIAVILTNFHDGKPLPVEGIKNQLKKDLQCWNSESHVFSPYFTLQFMRCPLFPEVPLYTRPWQLSRLRCVLAHWVSAGYAQRGRSSSGVLELFLLFQGQLSLRASLTVSPLTTEGGVVSLMA